jgi:hypothetical protein
MQDSDKSNPSDGNSSFFDRLASLYKDMGWKPLIDWNKPLFFPRGRRTKSLRKVLEDANKTLDKSTKFLNKIKSRELACITRAKSLPANATIRKEYIKCGKEICEELHGPYYYAYWKDPESKKLKKKYIGTHMPKSKGELNCDSTIMNENGDGFSVEPEYYQ